MAPNKRHKNDKTHRKTEEKNATHARKLPRLRNRRRIGSAPLLIGRVLCSQQPLHRCSAADIAQLVMSPPCDSQPSFHHDCVSEPPGLGGWIDGFAGPCQQRYLSDYLHKQKMWATGGA